MSMTLEEAIALLNEQYETCKRIYDCSADQRKSYPNVPQFMEALGMALTALRHQIWEDQLWHNAKTDPPKTPGLYYGKKDDTNSMYACQYRDGVWVLDMYPQQKMDIVQWADYTAFVRGDD